MDHLNDMTDLQAVDYALSKVIADCYAACASSGPKAFRRFLARPNPEKIFYVKNDDGQDAMRKVARRVDDDGQAGGDLPAILYYREMGLNGDSNQYATVCEATRFIDEDYRGAVDATMRVTAIPVTLNYSLVFLTWDRATLDRMIIAWQAYIAPLGRKRSRFLVPYALDGESFEVGATINSPREVMSSFEQIGEGVRLWGARTALEVNTQVVYGAKLDAPDYINLTGNWKLRG